MTTNAQYMAEQINEHLAGGIIQGAFITPDNGDQRYGFTVSIPHKSGRKRVNVWVDCDAESNGPGWLAMEEA